MPPVVRPSRSHGWYTAVVRQPATRAFTATELCTSLALFALVFGAVVPAMSRLVTTASERKQCFDHLREIGQAMQLYAAENKGSFPRAVFNPGGGTPVPTAYTRPLAVNTFSPGGPEANDVSAALFLLLRTQDLQSRAFVCPSAPAGKAWDFAGRTANQVSNFPERQFLSYSYANPYPSRAAMDAGFKMNTALGSDFALAADMNSGSGGLPGLRPTAYAAQMKQANSRSHGGEGQNVLYADGHVEFQPTPFCGAFRPGTGGGAASRDNIYTAGRESTASGAIGAPPGDPWDSVLLPTFLQGPAPAPGSVRQSPAGTAAPAAPAVPAPPAQPPNRRARSRAGPADVHVHHVVVTHSGSPWFVVAAILGAFVVVGGLAVFVIVVARSATRIMPAAAPVPLARVASAPPLSRPPGAASPPAPPAQRALPAE